MVNPIISILGWIMAEQDRVFFKIAEALLVDYSSVYYVNAVTNEYFWYSVNPEFHSLSLEQGGDDFFKNIKRDCKLVIYEEDQHIFLEDIQKDKLLSDMKKGSMQKIEYRLIINGVPTWHSLRLIRGIEENSDYFILGVINIDEEHKRRELEKENKRQKEIYNQITSSLAGHYDNLYYIDVETSHYFEVASTDEYKKLNVPPEGNDFFAESRKNIRKYVHPEDQDKVITFFYKDDVFLNLKNKTSFSIEYRLVVDNNVKHVRYTVIISRDGKHLIVCLENIDKEVETELALKISEKKSVTYTQIAESLASNYDLIYYVDSASEHYTLFTTHKTYGGLEVREEGEGFFGTAVQNVDRMILPSDRGRLKIFLNKDNFISGLEHARQLIEDYRMYATGGNIQYTRLKVMWSSDHTHFIICVENRDEYVKREKEHIEQLTMANELARRDGLTGIRNITAYREMETELDKKIEERSDEQFGIVVFDINDLKVVNDTQGHKAGDELIKESCKLVCRTFSHSPVYRIGGDEFIVILKGSDYNDRINLFSAFKRQVEENLRIGEGPVVAAGMTDYRRLEDRKIVDMFKRADESMYNNKSHLKDEKIRLELRDGKNDSGYKSVPEDRRTILDTLFKAFDVVAEGTYVYICDMKYDFSRWSKNCVDTYGLPSEYMYGAGDIWEGCIHPEDREGYHKAIENIFAGDSSGHNMQYRVKNPNGEYDVCTCRGIVMRDLMGNPDYFAGTIRNHGSQGHIDTLTGLRNQYSFFEDLDGYIKRSTELNVLLLGISKFSEINEMYGYHFGNRVLQLFARKVLDTTGNTGHCYRLDGTKFAVISNSLSVDEIKEIYEQFRDFFRDSFEVEGKKIILNTNCGLVAVDHFDFDSQTVYGCLNYAYSESKSRHQGNLMEFHNDLNDYNRHRLEKLHDIRASIMHGYKGFYLMYQPVVDAKTEKLIGAEALLRWKNDTYGVVPPDQFIPLLESDPMFPELGEWIIKEAIIASKKIIESEPDFVINVNLSYTQLEKPDFVDMVFRILDDMEYPPDHICFEVTERCRLLDIDHLKNVTARLKSRGILVALDDFGTGFSSVGIVKELPFDIIKIDRGFIQKIEESKTDRELIKYFSGLASLYGAKVCVEGIETEGMRDILQNFGVGSFQGYYYAKPLMLDQFFEWRDSFFDKRG